MAANVGGLADAVVIYQVEYAADLYVHSHICNIAPKLLHQALSQYVFTFTYDGAADNPCATENDVGIALIA